MKLIEELRSAAIHEELPVDRFDGMSIKSRCQLISGLIVSLKNKEPHKIYGSGSHVRRTLENLISTLNPSEAFIDFQNERFQRFMDELQSAKNSPLLNGLRHWDGVDKSENEKQLIVECARLHQDIYTRSEVVNIHTPYIFTETLSNELSKCFRVQAGKTSSNLITGEVEIFHNIKDPFALANKAGALEIAHHETTHAIQFCFAMAYQSEQLQPSHPLYDDAKLFHTIESSGAYIPGYILKRTELDAYTQQPHERLAFAEGYKLSDAITELSQ